MGFFDPDWTVGKTGPWSSVNWVQSLHTSEDNKNVQYLFYLYMVIYRRCIHARHLWIHKSVRKISSASSSNFFVIGAKKFLYNSVMFRCGAKGSQKLYDWCTQTHGKGGNHRLSLSFRHKIRELCAQPCRFSQCTCLLKWRKQTKQKKKKIQFQPI